MDSVGERIKRIRISKGITQAELADALGTTKATISRYESDKRELRSAQAQNIADFLGVSVFELYGVPSQQQIILERQQKIADRAKEMKQCNIEGATTEELLKRNEELQTIIDSFEKERQNILNALIVAHNSQVKVNILAQAENENALNKEPQPEPAITQRNKRIDNLISMFNLYPYDVQIRILDIVSTFGRLNSVGQKHAVGRIKELAELPRYQVQKENGDNV